MEKLPPTLTLPHKGGGNNYARSKLVKVWTTEGVECWVLIHVEVQTARDAEFPRRMYVYNYRIFDRYNRPVASLAVKPNEPPRRQGRQERTKNQG